MNHELDKDTRMWAMICHLAGLAGYLIPFGNVVGPLIIWQVKREESPFIDENGREALNFQLSYLLYFVVCILLMFVIIGVFLIIPLVIANFVFMIIAAVRANNGESYRIPFIIRFF